MSPYREQRRWIQNLFHRLDASKAWYDYDNPKHVVEARFLAEMRDIDRYTSIVGATIGALIGGVLLRKFSLIEASPLYALFILVGKEANTYRSHDVMYTALIRGLTNDPEHPY